MAPLHFGLLGGIQIRGTAGRPIDLPSRSQALLAYLALALGVDPGAVDVDVRTFEQLVAEGAPERLARAALCYRGELLEGLSVHRHGDGLRARPTAEAALAAASQVNFQLATGTRS